MAILKEIQNSGMFGLEQNLENPLTLLIYCAVDRTERHNNLGPTMALAVPVQRVCVDKHLSGIFLQPENLLV